MPGPRSAYDFERAQSPIPSNPEGRDGARTAFKHV